VANDAVLGVNVIDVADDEVVAKDAVAGVNVILVAAEAVVAKDADNTVQFAACVELETTPSGSTKLPLILPKTLNDPVN